MKKEVVIAAIFASFCTLPARAFEAPSVVGLHLATVHSASGFCNVNPGAYAVWEGGFTVGTYRNSECEKVSAYAGWTWQTEGRLRAGLTAGLVTGYRRSPVMPLLVPSIAFDLSPSTTVRLTYVPKVEKGGAHALHVALEFPL